MEDSSSATRLKFYGPQDLANGWTAEEAVALIREHSERSAIGSLNDALELHNALYFEEHGIFPKGFPSTERDTFAASARQLRSQLATFFTGLEAANLDEHLTGFDYQYAEDLLDLLLRFNVAQRVGGQELFDALIRARMPLAVMLSDRRFVQRHDRRLRDALLTDPRNGQLLITSQLIKGSTTYSFPASFSGDDWQLLLGAYIDSESPHPNYIEVIAEAKDDERYGITPKIRLRARKRCDALMQELAADPSAVRTGSSFGVGIDTEQVEAVSDTMEHEDGRIVYRRSFGEKYLLSTMEPSQVLGNFESLLGYMSLRGVLMMPSVPSQRGPFQPLLIAGKHAHPRDQLFKHFDALTYLGTHCFTDFLRQKGVEVEEIVAWFFREHLPSKYGAENFFYTPSSPDSSFLERCRHIGPEMESVVKQFTIYRDDGELDLDLLRMTSASRPWGEIPSLTDRKYVQRAQSSDCDRVLHLLFNDQSRLTFINRDLKARSFVELVTANTLSYADLHHFQKEPVDWLISEGLVAIDDGVIEFGEPIQVLVLNDINEHEAGAYGHYGPDEAAAALALVQKGWLQFRPTLLTSAEASYFNFMLNKSEFSNGPDLRNRYSHGTNPDPTDTDAHQKAYVNFIRLLVALVLKIRDDFEVAASREKT